MVESEASILDSQGLLEKSPPSLGGKSLSELLKDGTVRIDVDPKYPQAVGISTIVERVSIFGNAEWEILHNDDPNSPFFTSDFPVAIESTNRPRVQSKLTTARCLRLPASGVHGPVRVARRPPLRAAEAGAAFATPTIVHFGSHLQPQPTNGAHWRTDVPQIAADFAAPPKVGRPDAEILHPFRRRAKMV